MNHCQLIDIWKDSQVKDIPDWVKYKLLNEHACPKNFERTMYDIALHKKAAEKFIPEMSAFLGFEVAVNDLWVAMFYATPLRDINKITMSGMIECLAGAIKFLIKRNRKTL